MGKKSAVFISAILAATMLLSSCNAANGNKTDAVNSDKPIYEWGKIKNEALTVWGDSGDITRPYITRAFDNYEAITGTVIERVVLPKKEIDTKVANAFQNKEAEKPDILLSYGGTNIGNLNIDENFYDFTNEPWVEDLTDTSINRSIYNSKVIGLPYGEASVSGTLYNKQIFKNLNLEIPKTQEEFLSVCETLLQNGITPVFLPYADITMLLYQFPLDSIVSDDKVLEDLNSGTLSYSEIPEMYKIIEWYKTMSNKGYFGEDYLNNNWDGMDPAMKSGECAMMLCWDTWLYTNFTGKAENFGLMPAFMGVPENGTFEGANIMLTMVNKNSENVDTALDLISFMADPCNYNVAYDGIYTTPMFKNQTGSITTQQYYESERLIDKLYCDSIAWSGIEGFSQIDAMYIQRYMQNECSAEECLKDMDIARLKRAGNAIGS